MRQSLIFFQVLTSFSHPAAAAALFTQKGGEKNTLLHCAGWAIALVAVVSGCILVGAAIAAGVYKRVGSRVPFKRFQDQPSPFDTSAVQLSFK